MPGSKYEVGRSNTLLEVKTFHDAEERVVAHAAGAGRHKGRLGALVVELADGTRFNVGTGFSDAERESPPPLGSIITFRYQELSDAGVLVRYHLTGGEMNDITQAARLLETAEGKAVVADGAYDSDALVENVTSRGMRVVIPSRANRREPRELDPALSVQRNVVERCFGRLKSYRRVATRYFKKKATARASFRLRNKGKGERSAIRVGVGDARAIRLPTIGPLRVRECTRNLRRTLQKGRAKILFATVSWRSDGRWL